MIKVDIDVDEASKIKKLKTERVTGNDYFCDIFMWPVEMMKLIIREL